MSNKTPDTAGVELLFKDAGKFGVSVILKAIQTNPKAIDTIAEAMADGELGPGEWGKLKFPERRAWKDRARDALGGLNRLIYTE